MKVWRAVVHVLMLPSWYPENFDDLNGIFFREQAEALASHDMQVGVISVDGISINHPVARSRSAMTSVTTSLENSVLVLRAKALRPLPFAHRVNAASLARRWQQVFAGYVNAHGMPDVLHAHSMRPGGIAAQAISREVGLPYLITEHRPESAIADSRIRSLQSILRRTQEDAQDLIAVSPGFAEALNTAYDFNRWRSLPNLLPPQFEAAKIATRAAPFTFGHVSNLDPVKRVDLLIDAFYDAFKDASDVLLRIAGDSINRAALEQRVRSLGVSNIRFVGNVSREQIVEEFSTYDSFVLPSSIESFGVALWEAMSCGLPVIATNTDGGKLAVTRESGYLVPRDEKDTLVASFQAMRSNYGSFDRQAIRDRAVGYCGAEAFVGSYRETYERAISAGLSH